MTRQRFYFRVRASLRDKEKLSEALNTYRRGIELARRLVADNPSNLDRKHNLVAFDVHLGHTFKAQGNLAEALKSYREGFKLAKEVIESEPENRTFQRDLFACYLSVGDVLEKQSNFLDALKSYCDGLKIAKRLSDLDKAQLYTYDKHPQVQQDLKIVVDKIKEIALRHMQAGNFPRALESIDEAISVAPDLVSLCSFRAHVLMFLGREQEARAIYFQHRGYEAYENENRWEMTVLGEFADLRAVGLTHKLMDEVGEVFAVYSQSKSAKRKRS